MYRKLESHTFKSETLKFEVYYCIENWPFENLSLYYSIFSMTFQYIVPIIVVSGAHFGMYNKLKHRAVVLENNLFLPTQLQRRDKQVKRTNYILMAIAIIFGISW